MRHHDKPLSHQSDSASCEQNPQLALKDEGVNPKRELIDFSGYTRTKNGLLQKITVESVKKRNPESDQSKSKNSFARFDKNDVMFFAFLFSAGIAAAYQFVQYINRSSELKETSKVEDSLSKMKICRYVDGKFEPLDEVPEYVKNAYRRRESEYKPNWQKLDLSRFERTPEGDWVEILPSESEKNTPTP